MSAHPGKARQQFSSWRVCAGRTIIQLAAVGVVTATHADDEAFFIADNTGTGNWDQTEHWFSGSTPSSAEPLNALPGPELDYLIVVAENEFRIDSDLGSERLGRLRLSQQTTIGPQAHVRYTHLDMPTDRFDMTTNMLGGSLDVSGTLGLHMRRGWVDSSVRWTQHAGSVHAGRLGLGVLAPGYIDGVGSYDEDEGSVFTNSAAERSTPGASPSAAIQCYESRAGTPRSSEA